MTPLSPGARIGILGGGQLGRMLALAAARLGFDVEIYTDEPDGPAARVAAQETVAAFDDEAALAAFAARCDAVTAEFENVPAGALEALGRAGAIVRPGAKAFAVAQDRVEEKRFLRSLGVATAPFAPIASRDDLAAAVAEIGAPAVLKTRRFGYDGKGQARLSARGDADAAFAQIGGAPAILEGFVRFEREVSIVAARGADGAFAAYDLAENRHENGVLRFSRAPANASQDVVAAAETAARRFAEAVEYVGVFCIEFFETAGGALLANEIAPRVHNSGHWTQDGAATSQFEQHIRAVAGWPLGPTTRIADVEMENLLGADVERWAALAADPAVRLHLYGKRSVRDGRKMGHANRILSRV